MLINLNYCACNTLYYLFKLESNRFSYNRFSLIAFHITLITHWILLLNYTLTLFSSMLMILPIGYNLLPLRVKYFSQIYSFIIYWNIVSNKFTFHSRPKRYFVLDWNLKCFVKLIYSRRAAFRMWMFGPLNRTPGTHRRSSRWSRNAICKHRHLITTVIFNLRAY